MPNPILQNGRKTIALLGGSMTSFYQSGIIKGAVEVCNELDFNLITYMGGPIDNPDKTEQTRDTVFNLVDPDLFDGIIIPTGSHTRYISESDRDKFLKRFNSIPIVNISGLLDSVINVAVDFQTGIKELLEHFIDVHGYKRIAFIRGPKNHPSSELREQEYRSYLKSRDIKIDEKLIVIGDLKASAGERSIQKLLDINKAKCDAIITVNDKLANSIIKILQGRGVRVPDDIAIAGSQNSPICKHTNPPLTSIIEPTFELGRAAVYALNRKFHGEEDIEDIFIPTSLAVRESCGCGVKVESFPINYVKNNHIEEDNLEQIKYKIFKETVELCQEVFVRHGPLEHYEILPEVYNNIESAFLQNSCKSLLSNLGVIFTTTLHTDDLICWLEIAIEIKRGVLNLLDVLEDDTYYLKLYKQLDILKEKYHIATSDSIINEMGTMIDNFRVIINSLNASFNISSATDQILETLGSSDLFISKYNNNIYESSNILAVKDRSVVEIERPENLIKSKDLIPQKVGKIDKRYSYLVYPLSYRQEATGLLILDFTNKIGLAYENLQVIISTVLKNENHIKELEDTERTLIDYKEHLEDLVEERTEKLESSLLDLKNTQKILIESEKMATLGSLVAGVAHQMNTPLGICVTLLSHISETTDDIALLLKRGKMSKSNLMDFLDKTSHSANIALSNLRKAAENINQFKMVSVVNSQDDKRKFELKSYIEQIIENIEAVPSNEGYTIKLSCPEKIEINSFPGAMNNIISHLVNNAIEHGYLNRGFGEIIITAEKRGDLLLLSVKDFGVGIQNNDIKEIFNPFYTTKSSAGKQGLGLNVVSNLVYQSFRGSIDCYRTKGGATEFIMELPI